MAQVLKPELRSRLLDVAEELFAEAGYQGATMAQIAERAGLSTGNVYRYFANKDALFYEVVSAAFAARFMRLLKQRVGSLGKAPVLASPDAAAQADGELLLQFWIQHRRKVIVLLDRAQGSRYEGFAERFVRLLVRLSVSELRRKTGRTPGAVEQAVLRQVFRNTVRMIVSILESYADEASIRRAFQGFWSYQLAGLAGFSEWVHHA